VTCADFLAPTPPNPGAALSRVTSSTYRAHPCRWQLGRHGWEVVAMESEHASYVTNRTFPSETNIYRLRTRIWWLKRPINLPH
jgi:hypothetical protein